MLDTASLLPQKRAGALPARYYTGEATLAMEQVWSGVTSSLDCVALVVVIARLPDDALEQTLQQHEAECKGTESAACPALAMYSRLA